MDITHEAFNELDVYDVKQFIVEYVRVNQEKYSYLSEVDSMNSEETWFVLLTAFYLATKLGG